MRSDPLAGGERPISRAAEGRRIGERELIGMMALLMACNAFGIDAILPALDDLAGSLGAQGNDRQFVVGIYLLAGGIGTLIPGAFADRYGRRPVLFTALGFYIAFSLACALVTSFTQLIAVHCGILRSGDHRLAASHHPRPCGRRQDGADDEPHFVIFLLSRRSRRASGRGW